ncbi:MAG: hypothetical protein JJT75_14495, partial [Opitutales bacterium]|nr:hypothetical protein [Opitutales bacterium]
EVQTLWGTYLGQHYGWEREGKDPGDVDNVYIRRYWTPGLEFSFLLLDYADYTGHSTFLQQCALPFIREILTFFSAHFPQKNAHGKRVLYPAQCIEMWHTSTNPAPDIAGLRAVLERVLQLPDDMVGQKEKETWNTFLSELPALPEGLDNEGNPVLRPVESAEGEPQNMENPELYAVFPFRLFTARHDPHNRARRAFQQRTHHDSFGWHQHIQQAALLGLTEEATKALGQFVKSPTAGRFPAFWGPNFDWIPDQDHGSNILMGTQTMLLQSDGETIHLFPAWPRNWNVHFRLHAPQKTVVEATLHNGILTTLEVTPAHRANDVKLPEGWKTKDPSPASTTSH